MVISHSYVKLLTRGYHCEIHDHDHHGQESRFIIGVSSDSSGPQQSGYATLTWSPNRILRHVFQATPDSPMCFWNLSCLFSEFCFCCMVSMIYSYAILFTVSPVFDMCWRPVSPEIFVSGCCLTSHSSQEGITTDQPPSSTWETRSSQMGAYWKT